MEQRIYFVRLEGKKPEYRRILCKEQLMKIPPHMQEGAVPYLPKDGEDCWFWLELREEHQIELPPSSRKLSDSPLLAPDDLMESRFRYLGCLETDGNYMLQRLPKKSIISRQTMLRVESMGNGSQAQDQTGFLIHSRPDCVYNAKTGRLYFVSLTRLYRFFPGLHRVPEEERQYVLDRLSETKFAGFDGKMTYQKVSERNLGRIAAAAEKINALS